MIRRNVVRKAEQGFTIVELMIATLVFSLVLILITVGVLSFTRAYYKGVNQSNTQAAARSILENVSQAIQFSGDTVTPQLANTVADGKTYQGICIGSQRYSFVRGWQQIDDAPSVAEHQTKNVLVLDKPGLCAGLPAQGLNGTLSNGSVELISPRMRISKLRVEPLTGTTDTYKVSVRVVYGDDDLLNDPTGENANCNVGIKGSQYCAQAELTTTVKKRVAH